MLTIKGIALTICFCILSFARELPFTHYTPDNELNPLPSASIYNVYQDRAGYIWICVYSSGLARYDGNSLELYTTAQGLPNLNVMNVTEDGHGRLWVLNDVGIAATERVISEHSYNQPLRFATSLNHIALAQTSISQVAPNAIARDADGNIWVGTTGLGVIRYRLLPAAGELAGRLGEQVAIADTFSTDPQRDGRNQIVYALLGRKEGAVWCAAGKSLLVFNPATERFEVFADEQDTSLAVTHTLYETSSGVLWGGYADGAIWRLNERRRPARIKLVNRQLRDVVYAMLEDSEGTFWITSFGSGLLKLSPGEPGRPGEILTTGNGLLSDALHDVCRDREGNLWFAQNGGVSKLRYNHRAFLHLSGQSPGNAGPLLPIPNIDAVIPPQEPGTDTSAQFPLWLATMGGAVCLKNYTEAEYLDISRGLPSNTVYDLCIDEKKRLWIGNFAGLNCVADRERLPGFAGKPETTKIRLLGQEKYLAFYDVGIIGVCNRFRIPRSETGPETVETLWFNSYKRIICFAEGDWFIFDEQSGIPPSIIYTAAIDGQRRLWVGSGDRGLFSSRIPLTLAALKRFSRNPADYTITEEVFHAVWNTTAGAPTNEILELICRGDTLWAGTSSGLYVIRQSGFKAIHHFTQENGLANNSVVSMAISPVSNTIWAGTNKGLAEIDPRALKVIRRVTREEGLLSNETHWLESVAVGSDGRVYFGTPRGLTIYNPALDKSNPAAPLLRVKSSSFTEDNRGNNQFAIEYTALSFANEKQVLYRSRLRGYDPDWSPETRENKIRYTNLPAFFWPRDYTFEVFAANNSGIWTESPLGFSFSVKPAWWLRWWAFLLYGGALFLLIRTGKWIAANWQALFSARKRMVSHYKLGELLGKGGMGEVYQALDLNSKATVALKLLNEELLKDPENRKRFSNEGRLLASFSHPHIVKVYEIGETETQGFIAMEYLPGGTLKDYLAGNHPLAPEKAGNFLLQIAAGLLEIHSKGIIHRDLKTGNIMLDSEGRVRIMDFGLSKSSLVSTMTSRGTVLGTLGYVAPEQVTGMNVDQRADIFSFGVIIYEFLTGKLPFSGENEMALIHAIFNTDPPPPSQLRGDISGKWDDLVARCLAKNPGERFQTVRELSEALSAAGIRG